MLPTLNIEGELKALSNLTRRGKKLLFEYTFPPSAAFDNDTTIRPRARTRVAETEFKD